MEVQEEAISPLPQDAELFNSNAMTLSIEELQELRMSSDCSDVSGRAFVLSYAPPDVVRQAKLEALGLKVRRKMLERKVSLNDPFALTCGHHEAVAPVGGVKISAKTSGVGSSRELVQSLVVPPELTEHGEEVSGSSEVILAGQRREYQRPGPAQVRAPRGPTPSYRMHDPAKRAAAAAAVGGKGRGAARGADGEQGKEQAAGPAAGGSVRQMGGGAGAGRLPGKAKTAQSELKAQLSDGMLTYVPSTFERPKGLESTAFVPQVQAIMEARSKYESVKQRRPSSAPPRRSTSMAGAALEAGPGGQGRSGVGAPDAGDGGSRALADRAPNGGAGGVRSGAGEVYYPSSAAAAAAKGWWQKAPVVRVQEIDLLATYRQNSQHLLAQTGAKDTAVPEPQLPRGTSSTISSTIQTSPAADKRPGSARGSPAGAASAVMNGRARGGVSGASSLPSSRRQLMPAAEPHAQGAPEGVRQHRTDAAAGVGSGQRPRSPLRREVTFSGPTAAAGRKAAWGAHAVPTTAHSHGGASPSSGDPKPASGSPSRSRPVSAAGAPAAAATPGGQQPWSARTSSSASSSAVWHSPRPPSPGPARPGRSAPQRRASAPASEPSSASVAAASPAAASISRPASGGGGSHRVGFNLQPVDPETRQMLRQQQCGAAIGAAKANRVRGPARSAGSGSASHGGGSSSENGGPPGQPAWTTSSSIFGSGQVDRLQLQERILDGLVRQYSLGQEEGRPPPAAATPSGGGGGVTGAHKRGSSRPGSIDASGVSGGGGGGTITVQRNLHAVADHGHGHHHAPQPHQQQKAARPQSAPNRRVRPPSAGSWAGRPDPEALRSALSSHASTGVVYDPELHPSPLDTYMNQLVGLD